MQDKPLQEVKEKTKTKVNTYIAVTLGVFALSGAIAMAGMFFGAKNEIENLSLVTAKRGDAQVTIEPDPKPNEVKLHDRGTLVRLSPGQKARFKGDERGWYEVLFTGTYTVPNPSGDCTPIFPHRAQMEYKEYDRSGKAIDEQSLTIGVCDNGWAVDVVKSANTRAVITIPQLGQ